MLVCLSILLSLCSSFCSPVCPPFRFVSFVRSSVRLSVCPTVCLSIYLSICPSVCSSLFRSPYLSICLSIDLSKVCLYVRLPAYQCPTKSVGPFSSYKTHATHNSCIRSDDELMFGMSIYENCTVANLHYHIS